MAQGFSLGAEKSDSYNNAKVTLVTLKLYGIKILMVDTWHMV